MFVKSSAFIFALLYLTWCNEVMANDLIKIGDWTYLDDTVMGGKSQGFAQRLSVDGRDAIILTGTVSTENNGGFIQVRRVIPTEPGTNINGVAFETKGNGDTYYIHIRNGSSRLPWQYYSAKFKTSAAWKSVTIPFDAFERSGSFMSRSLNKNTIKSLGLVAYGKDHNASVFISGLTFY